MSAPFAPENRHHLLLTEAHQLNEFLDARLVGAEVPDDQRLATARDVLGLALTARCKEQRGWPEDRPRHPGAKPSKPHQSR